MTDRIPDCFNGQPASHGQWPMGEVLKSCPKLFFYSKVSQNSVEVIAYVMKSVILLLSYAFFLFDYGDKVRNLPHYHCNANANRTIDDFSFNL